LATKTRKRQNTEDRIQKTEYRRQRTEDRRQKTEREEGIGVSGEQVGGDQKRRGSGNWGILGGSR
jgi:hypothetical protein